MTMVEHLVKGAYKEANKMPGWRVRISEVAGRVIRYEPKGRVISELEEPIQRSRRLSRALIPLALLEGGADLYLLYKFGSSTGTSLLMLGALLTSAAGGHYRNLNGLYTKLTEYLADNQERFVYKTSMWW